MTLTLPTPANIQTVKPVIEMKKTFNTLTVQYYMEKPEQKLLQVKVVEIRDIITVFSGAEYDAVAANWTDADVANKISAMYP